MFKIILILMCSNTALGLTIKINQSRTIRIGEVDGSFLKLSETVNSLSLASSKPIFLLINSPGGNIIAGQIFLNSMILAKARRVKFYCVVPTFAASMAFSILVECNYRFGFKYSKLLFHPARITLIGGYSSGELEAMEHQINLLERPLVKRILKSLKITKKVFRYHYTNETLFNTIDIIKLSPGWMRVIHNIKGLDNVFE